MKISVRKLTKRHGKARKEAEKIQKAKDREDERARKAEERAQKAKEHESMKAASKKAAQQLETNTSPDEDSGAGPSSMVCTTA